MIFQVWQTLLKSVGSIFTWMPLVGSCTLLQNHQEKKAGIEGADSVTSDDHKQLFVPMGSGVLLLKNPQARERHLHAR